MDVILPFKVKNEKDFFEWAFKMGIDEMSAHKFLFIIHKSDVDIFPKMGEERINILLYYWEMCEDYKLKMKDDEYELPEELESIVKILVAWSLDIWFSKEWDRCKLLYKHALIHCLNRARTLFARMPDMLQINWDFLLLFNTTPWQVTYLKALNVKKEKTLEDGALTIEKEEQMATDEDMAYLKMEQLPLIVLRLVKLFDQSSIDMVKTLCMKVIAAWNKVYYNEMSQTIGSRLPYVPPEDKRCLLFICHIYLMAVYEADDNKGYVIDNMINNIRFYSQGLQNSYAVENMKYTPARFIALTCTHLRVQKKEFFDFFIWNPLEISPVNLFGVIAQTYKSYLLGNILMELNNMNNEDFALNVALYKRLMNAYINERERSEQFILDELQKQEAQHYAHNIIQTVTNMTDFKSKICKGNRMSNIGNYENTDERIDGSIEVQKALKEEEQDDLRADPIFQNIPNNEEILYYVYEALSKKTFHGWHFAKIVLLFKIISHELNMIETWRYHPGLTTNFMLNLETKLSQHYTDMAKIFLDHPFIEQEFWLTAFYLNPTNYNYEAIKRLGIRNNRKRTDEQGRWVTGKDKIEAKYGLLSSTIDVKAISSLSNHDEEKRDYEPLFQALTLLRLPSSMIKDLLTVIFLARNKSFSWAVEWNELRRRCKALMSNAEEKKRFVELNMAEANDRLKYLHIDYEKYKNRPQLDYGSIEQGYENLINAADMDDDTEESEEEDDFEDDEDVYENKRGRGNKKSTEVIEDDNSQEDDPYLTGKRRTRATAAAALASFLYNSELGRGKRRKKAEEEAKKLEEESKLQENEEKSNESKSVGESESTNISSTAAVLEDDNSKTSDMIKRNIKECLKERPVLINPTYGFQPLIDLWNMEKADLDTVDSECVSLVESSKVLNRFSKLKNITRELNPSEMCVEDDVREMQMFTDYRDITEEICQTSKPATATFKAICLRAKPIEEQEKDEKKFVMDIKIEDNPVKLEPNEGKVTKGENEKSALQQSQKASTGPKGEKELTESKKSQTVVTVTKGEADKTGSHQSEEAKDKGISSTTDKEKYIKEKERVQMDTEIATQNEILNQDLTEKTTRPLENLSSLLSKAQTDERREVIDNKSAEKENNMDSEKISDNDTNKECMDKSDNQLIEGSDESNPKPVEVNDENLCEMLDQVKTQDPNSSQTIVSHTSSSSPSAENSTTQQGKLTATENVQDQNEHILKSPKIDEEKIIINDILSSNTSLGTNIVELLETNHEHISNTSEKNSENVLKSNEPECENDQNMEHNEEPKTKPKNDCSLETLEELIESETEVRGNQEIIEDMENIQPVSGNDESNKKCIAKQTEHDETRFIDDSNTLLESEIKPDANSKFNKLAATADSDYISEFKASCETQNDDTADEKKRTSTESLEVFNISSSDSKDLENNEIATPIILEENQPTKSPKTCTKEAHGDTKITSQNESDIVKCSDFDLHNDTEKSSNVKQSKNERGAKDGACPDSDIIKDSICDTTTKTAVDDSFMVINDVPELDDNLGNSGYLHDPDMPILDSQISDGECDKCEGPECSTRPCKVLIRKLKPSDVANLRQPKVKVKRIRDPEMFLKEFNAKRRRFHAKIFIELEDSSDSVMSNSSSSDAYRPPKGCKTKPLPRRHILRKTRTSESECDSIPSQLDVKRRRLSTLNTCSQQSNNSSRSSSRQPSVGGDLVVTPRSASGLKLRISHALRQSPVLHTKSNTTSADEIIQLSSSDSNTMDSMAEVIEIPEVGDPLFEEEIII